MTLPLQSGETDVNQCITVSVMNSLEDGTEKFSGDKKNGCQI